MKNTLSITASLLLFAVTSFAQTAVPDTSAANSKVKTQMAELCSNMRLYNNQRAEAKEAMVSGNFMASKKDFAAADSIKQLIKTKVEALKNEGISNPQHLAHKELKKEDQKIIVADVNKVLVAKKTEKAAVKAGNATEALTDKAAVAMAKNVLKKDMKQSKRDSGWHVPFIKNNHLSHA
jgi:hypothetical protein